MAKNMLSGRKLDELSKLKEQYCEEGMKASGQKRHYLALKVLEIENTIRGSNDPVQSVAVEDLCRQWESTNTSARKRKEVRVLKETESSEKTVPSLKKRSASPSFSFCISGDENVINIPFAAMAPSFKVEDPVESYNPILSFASVSDGANPPAELNPFKKTCMNGLDVSMQYIKNVNMALVHNGNPVIDSLSITNNSSVQVSDLMAGVRVSPDYSDSFETNIPMIATGSTQKLEMITPPFSSVRLKQVVEAESGLLKLELSDGSKKLFTESYPIRLMPYNEWYIGPDYKFAETIASFIFPNDLPDHPAVEKVLSFAVKRLDKIAGTTSFDGYQSKDVGKVLSQARAIFDAIQQDVGLTYINPPASFEFTGQKVLSPRQIMENKRGTCLDTTVFYAACLERVGLHPVVFLIQGHAFTGVWLVENLGLIYDDSYSPKTRDYDVVRAAVEKMYLVPLESTLLTKKEYSFEHAISAWVDATDESSVSFRLSKDRFHNLVDVHGSRLNSIRPMPV